MRGSLGLRMMGCPSPLESGQIGNGEFVILIVCRQIVRIDVDEFGFSEVGNAEFPEDIIDDGGGEFDRRVP